MHIDSSLLPYLILPPLVVSGVSLCLPSNARNLAAGLAGAVTLAALAATVLLYPQIAGGAVAREHVSWLAQLGLDLAWRPPRSHSLFALPFLGNGALVVPNALIDMLHGY